MGKLACHCRRLLLRAAVVDNVQAGAVAGRRAQWRAVGLPGELDAVSSEGATSAVIRQPADREEVACQLGNVEHIREIQVLFTQVYAHGAFADCCDDCVVAQSDECRRRGGDQLVGGEVGLKLHHVPRCARVDEELRVRRGISGVGCRGYSKC
jgi:hypothetical protein